jgi:hypothetical protein
VDGRIDVFHYLMFHGEGRRTNVADWESCDHRPEDDLTAYPIQYTYNGYRTPDLSIPSLNFVASAAARAALDRLPGLAFAPVELAKVIYLPYMAGDYSYYDRADFRRDPRGRTPDTVFRRWPDRPELHAALESVWKGGRRRFRGNSDSRKPAENGLFTPLGLLRPTLPVQPLSPAVRGGLWQRP